MQAPQGPPCTACRRRRVRCSRTQPICSTCLTYRKARPTHLCVFPPAPPPRSTPRRSERVAVDVAPPGKAGQVAKVDSSATTVGAAPPVALPPSLVLPSLPTFPSSLSQHVAPLPTDVWCPPVAHRYAPPSALLHAAVGPPPPSRPALTAKQYSLSQHSLGSGTVARPSPPSPHQLEEPPWSLAFLLN
ncbi:hypothetical protein JCM9279_005645 [Rhodotorula babjevae]